MLQFISGRRVAVATEQASEFQRRGLLIILSSPSGVGKTTLARKLVEWDSAIKTSISSTTRKPRDGERDGREYYFTSTEEFAADIKAGRFLEHAKVFGHYYGTPHSFVETWFSRRHDVLFDIDWQGGSQLRNSKYGEYTVSIFVLPPSIPELARRLRARGRDSERMLKERMELCRDEIGHWTEYDFVLVNKNLDVVLNQIKTIVTSERLKRKHQTGLGSFVDSLYGQLEAG